MFLEKFKKQLLVQKEQRKIIKTTIKERKNKKKLKKTLEEHKAILKKLKQWQLEEIKNTNNNKILKLHKILLLESDKKTRNMYVLCFKE